MSKIPAPKPPIDMDNLINFRRGGTEIEEVPYDPGTQEPYSPEYPRTYGKDLWPRKFQYLLDVPRFEVSDTGKALAIASIDKRSETGLIVDTVNLLETLVIGSDPSGDIVEQTIDLVDKSTASIDLVVRHAATTSDTSVLRVSANLSDLDNVGNARDNLGLGSAALSNVVQSTGSSTSSIISQKIVTEELNKKNVQGTDAGQTRTNSQNDSRFVQGQAGTAAGQFRTNTQNDARFFLASNVKQEPGQSTTEVMSQKAVTDAIGEAGQRSVTKTTTLNGTTDNLVQATNLVPDLELEVGDVIRIEYSGYDKLHTVEAINSDNQISVNYEHAGNRGDGPLRLEDKEDEVGVKITRIVKWYEAPLGLGQMWVNVLPFRAINTSYTNTTGRTIIVHHRMNSTNGRYTKVNGVIVFAASGVAKLVSTFPVPRESYFISETALDAWAEMR